MSEHPLTAGYLGVFLLIVGVVLGAYTWQLNRRERDQIAGWLRTDGTVTSGFVSGAERRVFVAFTTRTGDRISFTARPGMFHRLAPADRVPVLYPPFQPTSAVVDPAAARRVRNSLLGGASLVLMLLGGYVAWYARGYDLRRDAG